MDGYEIWVDEEVRKTTDELPALDVRNLKRAGHIGSGQEQVEGVARLAWIPCNMSGWY